MTIQRKVLLEALKKVMPGIESGNAVLQGADSFIFHNGKIFTYNDIISVTVPIKNAGIIEEELEGAVKADEFFKIISKFSNDEINFVVTDNNSWILKCGKAKVEMNLLDFDYDSRLKGIEPSDNWTEIGEDLIEAVGYCKMSNNKTQLSGIYFKDNIALSTDGWQINKFEMKDNVPEFWISDLGATELSKISGIKGIQLQENWIHFNSEDGGIFSIKCLNKENYPIDKILRAIDTTTVTNGSFHNVFPKNLFEAIDRAVLFSMDVSNHSVVKLDFTKENINVSTESSTGKYNERIAWETPIENDFEGLSVLVDTEMMTFMSKHTLEFYVIPTEAGAPKLLFKSEKSVHLMSTFLMDK